MKRCAVCLGVLLLSAAFLHHAHLSSATQPATHWAFQQVKPPRIPAVHDKAWIQTPVDSYVLARLEAEGLKPSKPASRYTLIRRVYFDLIGLPPAAEQVEAFVADNSPDAFEKVVDRLLASPHYGERWARYWLDVARYADTKGYTYQEEPKYPHAWTYRDYLIRAFNTDKPYDRFLIEQIAADQLPLDAEKSELAALGFLTAGRRFLNDVHDIVDDRLDVIFRGTQGISIGCARCHDHRYDPISKNDYYSLYGVFANSDLPADLPAMGAQPAAEAFFSHERRVEDLRSKVAALLAARQQEIAHDARDRMAEYLLAVRDLQTGGRDAAGIAARRNLNPGLLSRWRATLTDASLTVPVFSLWNALAAILDDQFLAGAPGVIGKFAAGGSPAGLELANPLLVATFTKKPPRSAKEAAELYAGLFAEADRRWHELLAAHESAENKPTELPDADQEEMRLALHGDRSLFMLPFPRVERMLDSGDCEELGKLRDKLAALRQDAPPEPPRPMVLVEGRKPIATRFFKRENPYKPLEDPPHRFLPVLSGGDSPAFKNGSGRLELAQAIASRGNPVTARVLVNRVWMHHFGAGLVRTPSDFGRRGEPPTHPALLDYLAWQFTEDGWSIKKLHRLILLSSTYQQDSLDNPDARRADPENLLLGRMNRRRLDVEAMRDSMLAVSGRLDRTIGGPSADLTSPGNRRRTLYGFIDRVSVPEVLRIFDFANPESHSPQRFNTTSPQQALFLMNTSFVAVQARDLANRAAAEADASGEKVQQLYRLAYARAPSPEEITMCVRFLAALPQEPPEKPQPDSAAWQYGYGEFDPATRRIKSFERMREYSGLAWQAGFDNAGYSVAAPMLNAGGGQPGVIPQHSAIRRWISPADGVVTIDGTIGHASTTGDGVRARIVASESGLAGEWIVRSAVHPAQVERLQVKRGETIDFVVDGLLDTSSDAFSWAPVIRLRDTTPHSEWNAYTDFSGPEPAADSPLSPLEALAQALLMANEFVFVD